MNGSTSWPRTNELRSLIKSPRSWMSAAWFTTLTKRMKEIARDLACGYSTSEVAKKYGVTAGRISQLRRMLEESWAAFQGEIANVAA